jgi:DNA replication and repair protein RecF
VLVTGDNGTGKTNLLESLHVGTQGFSPRTRNDARLIRTGAEQSVVALAGSRAGAPADVEVVLTLREPKRASLNGARLASAEQLRSELTTLVFTPDRLAVVKGGPAVRRAYFDRTLARLLPSRAALPAEYTAALGQRNAALRRIAAGASDAAALAPWTAATARAGAELVTARSEAVALLGPLFSELAGELGLDGAALAYEADTPSVESLDSCLARDLERGATSVGPHLDDFAIRSGRRDLRHFGSQGEQRLAVLSLLLAEAELVGERRLVPPLVLLDDVLSELDAGRRSALTTRLRTLGQTLVTATSAEALPAAPDALLRVTPGRVETVA